MKLHLPVCLFRAIIALMVYTPIVSFSSPATVIPDTYDRIVEVDESSDYTIPYGATNVAYVLLNDISITINASSRKLFFTSDDNGEYGSLTLTGTYATQSLKLSSSTVEFHFLENITLKNFTSLTGERYSPIYTSDSSSRIIMANIENISLAGNSCADSDTSTYKDIHNNSYPTYGYYGGVIQNKGTYSVTGAGQINIDNNNAGTLTGGRSYVKVFGGAIYNENKMSFVSNGQISISGNTASLKSSYINSVYGGAVYNTGTGVLTFTDNGSITISGNAALNTSVARDPHSGIDLGSYATAGGIYSTGVISIRNNDSVIMRKNYSYSIDEGLYYMNSIEASGTVELSAPHGKSIIIEDNINIESGTFKLNEAYVNEKGYHAQTGDIIIDATNVESYLKDIKDAANAGDVLNSEIVYSKTSNVTTKTHLYDGRLIIRNGAIYNSADILLYNSAYSSATLYLDNGCANSTGVVTMYTGASLSLSGVNTMNAQSLEMSADCIWSFDLSSAHLTSAALTYTGSLTLGGKLIINLNSEESLEEGRYALLTLVSATAPTSSWTADNIIINAEEGMSASWDNLYWDNNTLYYLSSAYPVGALVWTGSGDMNWNTATQNWKINDVAALYSNSKDVIFSDLGAGEVTIAANYVPKSVLVENAAGKDYSFIGTGCLSGNMALTKKGEGTLTLATANTYTGGTTIQGGTVVAGTATALGIGTVSLTDATLKIDAEGVENALTTAGTSSILVQDGGSLALQSAITNAATGILTLSGKVDVSGIGELTKLDATLIDVNGNAGTSGFARTEGYTLQVVNGGKVLASDAQLEHSGLPTGLTLVLGENGLATAGAATDFTKYVIGGSHAVSVSEILKDVPQDSSLSSIEMSGGTLLVDAATDALAATGGTVTVNKAVTLGGTMSGGMLMAQAGEIAATLSGNTAVVVSGAVTLSGSNTHSGGVMLNGGALTMKHAQALGSGQLVTSGTSSLVIGTGVELALGRAISNSGSLSVSGKIQATGALNTEAATRVDVNGNSGASGFAKDALEWVQIVNGGTTVNAGAEISHNSATNALVLGSDGRAIGGGVIHHDEYLLTGTGVADVQRIMNAAGSELTSIKMQGGTLTVNADTAALLEATDGIIMLKTGGTIGSDSSVRGVDIKASGGSIAAILTGSNTLEGIGNFTLNAVIANDGILVLSGNIKADALSLVEEKPSTFVDVNGNSGTSGFSKSAQMSVQLTSGTGTTIDGGVTISHKDATDTLVLGKDGKAGYGGVINYTNYLLDGESDSASVSDIIADAGDALTGIAVQKGTLTVDAVSKPITVTGGAVVLDGGVLNGTLADTDLTLKNGSLGAASITGGTVAGVDYALGFVLNVSGTVGVSGSFNASLLHLVSTDAIRIDVNDNSGASGFLKAEAHSVQVFNGGTLDIASGTTVKHGGIDLLLGSNGYATSGGGITWSEYLLTGTDTADTSAIYGKSATAAIIQTGGILTVDCDAEVSTTAGTIELENGSLSGSISDAAITATGGSLVATLSGSNTLTGSNYTLSSMITNNGTLILSGSIKADALSLYTEDSTHIDVNGNSGTSGFSQSTLERVQLTSGTGTTIDGGVTITHSGVTGELVLGTDGSASRGGEIDYTNYLLDGESDSASVSDIIADAGDALTGITVQKGTLTVDAVSKPITATGGAVVLDGGVLNGTLADTDLTLKNGSLGAASITGGTVAGVDYALGSVLNVSGTVGVSGSFNASLLHLVSTDATRIDVNDNSGASGFLKAEAHSVQVFNGGILDIASGTTVKHGGIDLLQGSNGYATSGGGITWSEYLLTGEDSAAASAIYQKAIDNGYNGAVSITQTGGTLTVTADAEVTTTAGSITLTGGTLTGTISGATLSVTGGKLSATLSGTNTLSGANKLLNVLDNDGLLNICGSLDVTQLGDLTDHGVTYTKGGSNGFKTSSAYSIKLVDNSGSLNSTATIKHGEIDNFVLGSDGVATAAGTTDYKTYYITSGHAAAVDAIRSESGNQLTLIDMSGGILNANADAAVKVMGGEINLTAGELSGSISGATLGITGGKLTATLSGSNTLSGANKLLNVLDNEGTLNISGTLDVTQLGALADHGVTYTKGGSNGFKTSSAYSIKLVDNSGSLNSTATIKHGEIDNFVLGSDGVATAAGTTDYKTYYITSGHAAAVDAIRGESGNQLTLIDMSGGSLDANADATVKVMGGEVKLTAGTLTGSISGATLGITGGKLTATLSGSNMLSGPNKLINVLDNEGTLNISGTLDVTQLGALTDHGVTYTKGGSNGFKTSSAYSIKLVDNSGSLNSTATIKHGEIDNFVLGSDGVARAEGTSDYKTYFITAGHEATVDAIRGESGNQLTLIDMSGGSLDANADATVKVMGGEVKLTAGELSGSISGATLGITGGSLTAALSGTNTLSGVNKLSNVLDNDGVLNISGTLDVTQLGALSDHGVTYTEGGSNGFKTSSAYSIKLVDNSGSLNSTATIKHGEIDNFVLGSDGVARAEGTTFYDTYYITSGHEATVDAIRSESGNQLTLIDMSGGILNANADAAVKVMGGEVKLTAGELSGSISGATLSVSGGTLAATLSGNNTLVGDGYVLNGKLNNSGTLTLSGSFSIGSGLTVQHTDAGYESLNDGYDATNGFARTEWYSVDIADGDTADANATITYDGKTLKLGNDGVATRGGEVDYTMYYLNLGELSTKTLHDKVVGADITLKGGTLTVETQSTVTATGGAIKLVENGMLNGSLTSTELTLKAGTVNATITGGKVTGDAYALSEILQVSGNVSISGSFVADALTLTTIDAKRVDVVEGNSGNSGFLLSGGHSVQIINGGTLAIDAGTTVTHKDANETLTLGADGYATSAGTLGHEYLLVGNDTVNVGAILGADNSATIKMQGGTLNVDAATNALTATAGTINLNTDVELGGKISGATINASKGTLSAILSGNNTLVGDGYVLNSKLNNSGTLTLSGSFSIGSGLTVQHTDAGYESLNGSYDATNGFARTEWYAVDIADGDTADANATITYDGKTLKLGNDGVATRGGEVDYTMYYLNSGELSTKTLHDKVAGADITLKGGTLTVETQFTVTATGGAIELVENGVLNGSLTNTNLTLTKGALNAELKGGNTIIGDRYVLSEMIQNGGSLTVRGSFNASGLQLMTESSSRVDVVEGNSGNSGFLKQGDSFVQIINGGTLTIDGATVSHKDAAGALVLGTDGYARSMGGTSYAEYLLTGSDKVTTLQIHTGEGAGALVRQEGGQLRVNDTTEVKSTSGEIILSGATLSGEVADTRVTAERGSIAATLSGITAVTITDEVIMSGNNTHSGVTTLADATLTITHANALGSGDVVTTGDSKLVVSGVTLVLGDSIANTGKLTLKGSIDASGLTLNRTEEGRLGLDGTKVSLAESGFARGVEYSVQIVEGGTTVNAGASISHKDYLSRTQLVLGVDGVARAGGAVDYTHFFLTGGDSAMVSEIADVSKLHQETLAGVTMDSGELDVDQSIAVNATGGSIHITDDAVLSGTVEDTAVSTAVGDYSSVISALLKGDTILEVNVGAVTVSGDNSYSGGTVVNGGALFAGHDNAFGTGDVAVNDATLDLKRFTIANKVLMNGSSTLGNADGASHIVLGSGADVNFHNGFTLSSGKVLEVAAGGATYTGALTLGGGCIELDGKLTVQGNVTFESGTQTTIDISGWNGADDGEVLATLGSSTSGYTEESLKLAGIAGDWELEFDAATGVLTLVEVKVEPQPEPEFTPSLNRNQQVVYDTIKDIMGEGNPGGLLGELGKDVTGTRDEEKLKQLLDELGGAEYATLLSGQQAAARGHMRRLRGEMGSGHLLAGSAIRAYIEAYNHRSEVDGDAHGSGYELNESGGQFALEFLGEDSVSGGFAVAAGRSKLQPDGGMTQKSDNTYMDAFLLHRDGAYTGKFSLGMGVHKYDLERRVAGNAVSADASGTSVNFMHESAWAMSLSESHSVQVFGAVESSFNKLGAFREKGADTASLQVESQDAWVTTLSLGARYLYSFAALESAPAATLSLQGGLEFDFGDTDSEVEMNFEGARCHRFRQSGAERDTFGYNLGASLHLPVSAKAAIYANGDAVLRGDSYEVNANVGLQMAF